jgi:hypothetical protein
MNEKNDLPYRHLQALLYLSRPGRRRPNNSPPWCRLCPSLLTPTVTLAMEMHRSARVLFWSLLMHVPCTKISRVMMEKQSVGRDYSAPMPWTRLAWSHRYGSTSIECRSLVRYLSHFCISCMWRRLVPVGLSWAFSGSDSWKAVISDDKDVFLY